MLKTCLTVISIFIFASCSKLGKFPAKYIYEADTDNGVCGQYEIIDPKELKVKHVQDLPLKDCNGVFGFSTEDTPKVINYVRTAIKTCEENNKGVNNVDSTNTSGAE